MNNPNFERPPIFSQSYTVVFDRLDQEQFDIGHLGLFWSEIRNEFSHCRRGRYQAPEIEDFGPDGEPTVNIAFDDEEEPISCWFISTEPGEIIGVQADRFTYRWMKVPGSESENYPRFENTSSRFRELFARFCSFLKTQDISSPELKMCEMGNANLIEIVSDDKEQNSLAHPSQIFSINEISPNDDKLEAEYYSMMSYFRIFGDSNTVIGRLRSMIDPLEGPEGRTAYSFDLVARSTVRLRELEDVSDFFAKARDHINAVFMATTTKAAHTQWRLEK